MAIKEYVQVSANIGWAEVSSAVSDNGTIISIKISNDGPTTLENLAKALRQMAHDVEQELHAAAREDEENER